MERTAVIALFIAMDQHLSYRTQLLSILSMDGLSQRFLNILFILLFSFIFLRVSYITIYPHHFHPAMSLLQFCLCLSTPSQTHDISFIIGLCVCVAVHVCACECVYLCFVCVCIYFYYSKQFFILNAFYQIILSSFIFFQIFLSFLF